MRTPTFKLAVLAAAVTLCMVSALALQAQMAKPDMVTLSGKVIDMTCASKGKAMMDSWHNAENNEHKTPEGPKPGCAEMCLKGGQPAGLFDNGKIVAAFGCNPRNTLANFASQDVEVMGFWGGSKKDAARTFIPAKIRAAGGSDWQDVDCATMH